MYAKLVSGVVW